LTKLDVLSGMERVPVCVAYDVDGTRHNDIPMTQTDFHHARPIYEYLDGWSEDITSAKTLDDLPPAARRYVERIEQMSGIRVSAVGVGPARNQTIEVRPLV
jgi:adenylosuccinate synthase